MIGFVISLCLYAFQERIKCHYVRFNSDPTAFYLVILVFCAGEFKWLKDGRFSSTTHTDGAHNWIYFTYVDLESVYMHGIVDCSPNVKCWVYSISKIFIDSSHLCSFWLFIILIPTYSTVWGVRWATWLGWVRFRMFHHPAWAVGSYRSGQPAGWTPQI